MTSKALIVLVTAKDRKEADRIATNLVRQRLAACVSIVPAIYSRYWWNKRIEGGKEVLLMIKTASSRYKALEKRIQEIHSYKVPEILALPVMEGNADYLKWLKQSIA